MQAPAPQTIASEVNEEIVALGYVPVRERQEFMFLRKKQEIEKKIADLKKVDPGEAFAMEMKLSAVLLDKEGTLQGYRSAKHHFTDREELATLEKNFVTSLNHQGFHQEAVEHLLQHGGMSVYTLLAVVDCYTSEGKYQQALHFLEEYQGEHTPELEAKIQSFRKITACMDEKDVTDEDLQQHYEVYSKFIVEEGLFFYPESIEVSHDEHDCWISHYMYISADLDKVMDINDRWIDALIDADIALKVSQTITTLFVCGDQDD